MRVSLPVLDELPSGYFVDESPGGILALHGDVARGLHEAGFGPEHDGRLTRSELTGRRPLHEIVAGDERMIVRRFSHGGLLRWFTGSRFTDPERPFRELILSELLRRAGIPTPRVVAARARPALGGGWYLDLVARRVEGATDLGHILGMARTKQLDSGCKRAILEATGKIVRQLHRHGCLHADLTPANILIESDVLQGAEPRLWVIDLDRSVIFEKLPSSERLQNLRRLFRYVKRRESRYGRALSRADYQRFLRAYEPDRPRRKEILRSILLAHRRANIFHAFGWFFETLFGRMTDPRESSTPTG